MMNINRTGEQGEVPSRNGRFVKKEGYWYFTTREGVDIGPFDSRAATELRAEELIDFICESEPKISDLLKNYRAA